MLITPCLPAPVTANTLHARPACTAQKRKELSEAGKQSSQKKAAHLAFPDL